MIAAPRSAMITSGNVTIKRKNLTTMSAVGGTLKSGDIVATSATSTASLEFADGSKVSLSGGSAIEITSPGKQNTLMRALNGRVAAHLKSGKSIGTRSAMIRVKGTEIIITIAPDGATTLEVLEGAAEFFSPCGKVLVQRGQQSQAQPGNAPSAPTQIPNLDALLKEWQTKGIDFEVVPESPQVKPRADVTEVAKSVANNQNTAKAEVTFASLKPVPATKTEHQSPPDSESDRTIKQ